MPTQESPEAEEAEDTTERICAWSERLTELDRVSEARQVLLDALDGPGDPAPVMMALADLEANAGDAARAAELLRKVLAVDPGNAAAAYALARALNDAGKTDEAVRVITDARASAVPGTAEFRESAETSGELLTLMGRHAAAVTAFGPQTALSPYGRRLRRRAWWRSGGPLRQRRAPSAAPVRAATPGTGDSGIATAAGGASAGTAGHPADEILEAAAWATRLSNTKRLDEARKTVSETFTAHGRHPSMLICAARIEEAAGAGNTALFLWREAFQKATANVDIVSGLAECIASVRVKYFYDTRVKDALEVLNGFPNQTHPAIRDSRYKILFRNRSPSAARLAAALGSGDGLSWWGARQRRRLLRRSAGPLGQFGVRVIDRVLRPSVSAADRHFPGNRGRV